MSKFLFLASHNALGRNEVCLFLLCVGTVVQGLSTIASVWFKFINSVNITSELYDLVIWGGAVGKLQKNKTFMMLVMTKILRYLVRISHRRLKQLKQLVVKKKKSE